jgi:hypothetical protein
MLRPTMSAATIDAVLASLDAIIERSIATSDRRGFFAAVYKRVTLAVRAGIAAGDFDDGPRMERFDVIFANRYLDAYDGYERGDRTSVAWRRTFDAARTDDLFVLQHLLLGMNAHITLDLGIAAAAVAPGASFQALQGDFNRINDVLASLLGTVENELVSIVGRWEAPAGALLGFLEGDAHGVERSAAMLVMTRARSAAWQFATGLAAVDPADTDALSARITQQDEQTTETGEVVLLGGPGEALLARFGVHDVPGNIRVLAQGEVPP